MEETDSNTDSSTYPDPHPCSLAFQASQDSGVENTDLGEWGAEDLLDQELSYIPLPGRTPPMSKIPLVAARPRSCSSSPGRDLEPGLGVRPRASITSTSSWPLRSMMEMCTSPVREKRDSPARARSGAGQQAAVQNASLQRTPQHWKGHKMENITCLRTVPRRSL